VSESLKDAVSSDGTSYERKTHSSLEDTVTQFEANMAQIGVIITQIMEGSGEAGSDEALTEMLVVFYDLLKAAMASVDLHQREIDALYESVRARMARYLLEIRWRELHPDVRVPPDVDVLQAENGRLRFENSGGSLSAREVSIWQYA
jgi:hypothetical protein